MRDIEPSVDALVADRVAPDATLYALLVNLRQDALLLPNSAMAEVVGADRLQPRRFGALGVGGLDWQGRIIPVLDFEQLRADDDPPSLRRPRLVVLHAISQRLKSPVYAVLCEGQPQLIPVNVAALESVPLQPADPADFVLSRVRISMREALIPDLERIEAELASAEMTST